MKNDNIVSTVLGQPLSTPEKISATSDVYFSNGENLLNSSLFVEHGVELKAFSISAGGMFFYNSKFGTFFNGGTDIVWRISNKIRIVSSVNQSFRLPTFTDLYYNSKTIVGNADLKPERAITYETGIKLNDSWIESAFNIYLRQGRNMIDWVKLTNESVYKCQNVTEINTYGAEFLLNLNFQRLHRNYFIRQISLNYAYNYVTRYSAEYNSYYALDYLKHNINISVIHTICKQLFASWQFHYAARAGAYNVYDASSGKYVGDSAYQPYFLTNLKIFARLKNMEPFVEISNVFDVVYNDLGNILLPGRWVKAGISVKF